MGRILYQLTKGDVSRVNCLIRVPLASSSPLTSTCPSNLKGESRLAQGLWVRPSEGMWAVSGGSGDLSAGEGSRGREP